ncbi:MAG: hypothetical protein AAF251_05990 [Pseudomonadota bacterium]
MGKADTNSSRKDRVSRELDNDVAAHESPRPNLLPSPEASTNLLIADIIVRSASSLFRKDVERRVAKASAEDAEQAEDLLDGSTLIKSLALYGASKLATRSPVGLGLVAGGLALKTLYDRGKARQKRQALMDQRPPLG